MIEEVKKGYFIVLRLLDNTQTAFLSVSVFVVVVSDCADDDDDDAPHIV